ncbi:hypothetical protein ACFE04_014016 [Oxalis oulophora]
MEQQSLLLPDVILSWTLPDSVSKPDSVSDLLRFRTPCSLAILKEDDVHDDGIGRAICLTTFSVKMSKTVELRNPSFVVYLMNITENERIWNALHLQANLKVVEQVICTGSVIEKNCSLCSERSSPSWVDEFKTAVCSELDDCQIVSVLSSLNKLQCEHESFVELTLGPPGTGKTRTLSVLLCTLLRTNKRTLVCAPTNVAVAELAIRVRKLVKKSLPCSLSGIVCYTDTDVLKCYSDNEDICLELGKGDDQCRLRNASLIFCTVSTAYRLHLVPMNPLDFLVIDEAAQVKESELLIPLQLPRIRHVVLFGDECQLTAVVHSTVSAKACYGRSFFERISSLNHSRHLLNMQYRMHPSIISFPNSQFYRNRIFDAPNVRSQSYHKNYLSSPLFGQYSLINISCSIEGMDPVQSSHEHILEVAVVMKILHKLRKEWNASGGELSIGVISIYEAQVVAIREKLTETLRTNTGFRVKVDSIDGFQGGEVDITILSTARDINGGSIAFVADPHRINVALTRARHSLWILGNGGTLFNTQSVWKEIVSDAKERRCYFNADVDEDIAKFMAEVMMELNQFDNILNADGMLYKDARWKVLFSGDFKKSFAKVNSLRKKKLVMYLLLRLSCGWRPKKQNFDIICDKSSHIVKTFKVQDLSVVCSVEIIKESVYKQVLKVWDILPLVNLHYFIERLDNTFLTYDENYINHCKAKYIEGDLEVPETWSPNVDIQQFRYSTTKCLGDNVRGSKGFTENRVNNNLLLMKFYALSSGVVSNLLSNCDGTEMDFPFQLTDQEMDVVQNNKSSFILGRSGTGKSTVLIAKLFQREQLYHIASEGYHDPHVNSSGGSSSRNEVCEISEAPILRQIFVAANPRLCYAVKEHISSLKRSTCNEGESSSAKDNELVDYASLFSDIQDSFIDVPSPLYPLVISFHKFLMMLNGTIGSSFFETFPEVRRVSRGQNLSSNSVALNTFIRTKEVNFDRFSLSYWPHFNMKLTKVLECSSVFREIMSHIKGQTSGYCLSREDYLLLSERRFSTFSEQERDGIYHIFQQYEKIKRLNGEFDLADFVNDLHQRLIREGYKGDIMEFVYIDESQDLNMNELSLFKYVCTNFEEGFAFAGDTAQTIAKGVGFRFQDIRSLFYKEFLQESGKAKISDILQLSQNFRTHRGVLNMAQSVVDLLIRFFPTTIDRLSPETSLISGEVPVLLGVNEKHSFSKIFKGSHNNMVGFGAEQVLLVRDVHAKDELIRNVGKQALILTILECKGLEFQDVLIYNFFSSSPFKKWPVISEYMKGLNLCDSSSVERQSFVRKHAVMCSELKQLYVAITRTRHRLWFYEDGVDMSAPVFDFWRKLGFIKFKMLDDMMVQQMQVPSSQVDWKARGITLFHQGNYDSARMCFQRAGDSYWEKLAEAYSLRFAADCTRTSNPDMASRYLQKAAELFDSIDKPDYAAQCFVELKDYEKAVKIYLEKFPEPKWEEAGECLTLAGCYMRAAKVYSSGNLFSKCLSACADGQLFETGLEYIQSWISKDNLGFERRRLDRIADGFLEKAAFYYLKTKDFGLMMNFVRAFSAANDKRNFLEKQNCLNQLLLLEEEWGNFPEAAYIARRLVNFDKEICMLEKANRFKEAALLVHHHVLYNSLWKPQSEGWPLKDFERKNELLMKAQSLSKHVSENFHKLICTEGNVFTVIEDDLFKLEGCLKDSSRAGSLKGEILCARKILDYYFTRTYSGSYYARKEAADFVYFWNLWKKEIENVIEFLRTLNDRYAYKEFCLSYFGVRTFTIGKETTYQLLNPEANWTREINNSCVKKKGHMVTIDQDQFIMAATSFWSSEILSVGKQVLNYFKALYDSAVDNDLSVVYQSKLLTHIFNVSRALLKSKYLDREYYQSQLQKSHEKSVEKLFALLYPMDCRAILSREMIFERDVWTCKTLTQDIFYDLRHFNCSLTWSEFGKVLTFILGTGELSKESYEQIFYLIGSELPWNSCINEIIEKRHSLFLMGSNILKESHAVTESYIRSFHKVLENVFSAYRKKERDNISIDSFLYLVERFLLLVLCCKGHFFTTTSTFVEWMIHHEWDINSNVEYSAAFDLRFGESLSFIANMVKQLLYNDQDTMNWIEKSKMHLNCFPLAVLRLFIMLSLICVNTTTETYDDLLLDLLGRREVSSLLPWKFYDHLRENWKSHDSENRNFHVLSDALKKIRNRLVMVNFTSDQPRFPGITFVNLETVKGRGRIMSKLCLTKDLIHQTRPVKFSREVSGPFSVKMDCQQFWSEINLLSNTKDVCSRTMLQEVFLKMIVMINYAMQQGPHEDLVDRQENVIEDINKIMDALQQLYSMFDSSSTGGERTSIIQKLGESLISRRQTLDLLLGHEVDPVGVGKTECGPSTEKPVNKQDFYENTDASRGADENTSTEQPSNGEDCNSARGGASEQGLESSCTEELRNSEKNDPAASCVVLEVSKMETGIGGE